jgi:hypothetical protein
MSIDAPAAMLTPSQDANCSFNYIDTFVEYIAEVVLSYKNAIPESKDRQQKELQMHKQIDIVFQHYKPVLPVYQHSITNTHYLHLKDAYAFQFIKEINPPPPKA